MSDVLEIELRFRLPDDHEVAEKLEETLHNQGFKEVSSKAQVDTYYSSKHKDFIATEECLRVRTVQGKSEITWKPPSTADMKGADEFWKEEVDLQVDEQAPVAKRLLEALDFFEVATVSKSRRSFVGGDNVEISLDVVDHVGTFVELEVKHMDHQLGRSVIQTAARNLGLNEFEICRTPYRDLVREAKNGR